VVNLAKLTVYNSSDCQRRSYAWSVGRVFMDTSA